MFETLLQQKSLSDTGELYKLPLKQFILVVAQRNAYTENPTIKNILKSVEEANLDILAWIRVKKTAKWLRGPAQFFQVSASKTWFGHGTINCMDSAQVETFFRPQEVSHLQTTALGKASIITFAKFSQLICPCKLGHHYLHCQQNPAHAVSMRIKTDPGPTWRSDLNQRLCRSPWLSDYSALQGVAHSLLPRCLLQPAQRTRKEDDQIIYVLLKKIQVYWHSSWNT